MGIICPPSPYSSFMSLFCCAITRHHLWLPRTFGDPMPSRTFGDSLLSPPCGRGELELKEMTKAAPRCPMGTRGVPRGNHRSTSLEGRGFSSGTDVAVSKSPPSSGRRGTDKRIKALGSTNYCSCGGCVLALKELGTPGRRRDCAGVPVMPKAGRTAGTLHRAATARGLRHPQGEAELCHVTACSIQKRAWSGALSGGGGLKDDINKPRRAVSRLRRGLLASWLLPRAGERS